MKNNLIKGVTGGVLLLTSSITTADIIQIDYLGSVTSLSGSSAPGNGVINVGDTVSYSFTYEEQTTASTTGVTRYLNSIQGFSGTVNSYSFGGSSGDVFIRNDSMSGGQFNGNPFDQLSISNNNAAVYDEGFGLIRDDFDFTSGDVAGFPLSSFKIDVITDDTSFLSNLDISESALLQAAANPSLSSFRMFFMDGGFGTIPVAVSGSFSSITVTNLSSVPVPAAVWLFGSGLLGLVGFARRK